MRSQAAAAAVTAAVAGFRGVLGKCEQLLTIECILCRLQILDSDRVSTQLGSAFQRVSTRWGGNEEEPNIVSLGAVCLDEYTHVEHGRKAMPWVWCDGLYDGVHGCYSA